MPEVHSQELYSNPIAPPDQDVVPPLLDQRSNLSNDDFRKLLMTPRSAPVPAGSTAKPTVSPFPSQKSSSQSQHLDKRDDDKRKKRKAFFSKIRKEEEEREAEWAKLYRDRAKERRDGGNPDYVSTEDVVSSTSGYKAVAPDLDPAIVAARRKLAIQESKFLGGDMEHTHLVKGLDYALLQKVRSEIQLKQIEEEEEEAMEKKREKERAHREIEEDLHFKTKMAKNVCRTLFFTKPPERNELFIPGRMAYVYDLEDEYAESDIPTTLIRSKADCPNMEAQTTLSTNDIVINKLTQILSYLRQGVRATGKRGKRKEKGKAKDVEEEPIKIPPAVHDKIFADVGEYVFDPKAPTTSATTTAATAAAIKMKYFDIPVREEGESMADIRKSTKDFVKNVSKKYSESEILSEQEEKLAAGWAPADFERIQQGQATGAPADTVGAMMPKKSKSKKDNQAGFGGFSTIEHYAECYPGGMEEYDATYDSDEDADFSKMDMGNKKGPVKRWDFETEEEYNTYQSSREALPKAAFQYGVKMSEGRKTRRFGGQSEKAREMAKLNRQWQKISALIDKRKGGPKERSDESVPKRPKLE